ncbi:hypothetical protein B0H14DRAFT_2625776 [Mycena olivaceomarginata]|nr:hypothetical protein B0H14DRAFT_2625776 [Mycena olivaceomarginata]
MAHNKCGVDKLLANAWAEGYSDIVYELKYHSFLACTWPWDAQLYASSGYHQIPVGVGFGAPNSELASGWSTVWATIFTVTVVVVLFGFLPAAETVLLIVIGTLNMMYVDNGSPHRRGSLLPVRLPEPVCLEALHGAYKSDAPVQFPAQCELVGAFASFGPPISPDFHRWNQPVAGPAACRPYQLYFSSFRYADLVVYSNTPALLNHKIRAVTVLVASNSHVRVQPHSVAPLYG